MRAIKSPGQRRLTGRREEQYMKKIFALILILALACAGAACAEGTLPAYTYPGDDPIEAAVAEYTAEFGPGYRPAGCVSIPAPIILLTEETDEAHCRVYGNFWLLNYVLNGVTLECVSGGEMPAVLTLEKVEGAWKVVAAETAGDGEDYEKDIRRFCQGNEALETAYFEDANLDSATGWNVRHRFIRDYVAANGLPVEAYQDYGWDPIPLTREFMSAPVTGSLEDGSYILRVQLQADDQGEWRADEMAQDDSVVKLASSEIQDGVLTVRYDPVGDGQMAVYLRHFNGIACDEALGFDLLVKDGRMQEVTGGSRTVSPSDDELADYFTGEWLEKDTQFTVLSLNRNPEKGFDAEIISPVTHGAYICRATLYFDCELDAFVYENGTYYEVPITDSEEFELGDPIVTGAGGRLAVMADENGLPILSWYSQLTPEEPEILFVRAEAE